MRYKDRQHEVEIINHLGKLAEQLPYGYSITLEFTNNEGSATLENPEGDEVSFDSDTNWFVEAIEAAIDDELESEGT